MVRGIGLPPLAGSICGKPSVALSTVNIDRKNPAVMQELNGR